MSNYLSSFRNTYTMEFAGRDNDIKLSLDKTQLRDLIQTLIDQELIVFDEESQEIAIEI